MRVNVTVALRTHRANVHRNGIKPSMTNSGLRHHSLSELCDGCRRAAKNDGFDAIVVIQMSMHGGDGHVVMVVLHAREPARQLPLVMVVHVAERADAILGSSFLEAALPQFTTQKIAECLRSILVAPLLDQPIKGVGKVIVDRNR